MPRSFRSSDIPIVFGTNDPNISNEDFLDNNYSDLKRLQEFFNGLDEGGHTYVAKVLEIAISTSMKNKLFKQGFDASHSEYYSYTVELLNNILQLQ